MGFLIAGIALMGGILSIFMLKGRFPSPALNRIAYHELTARLAVIAAVFILVGLLVAGNALLETLGIVQPT
ncbi:MAG: hypothetical protein RIB80_05170 [Rhodospirillales bacterium]